MTEIQATIIIYELFGIFWILLSMFLGMGRTPKEKETPHG